MGNYLKLFDTVSEQNTFRNGSSYIQPHVSCLSDGSSVKYNLYSNEHYEKLNVPFTIEATQDGTTVYFRQSDYAANDGLDQLKVEISTDLGQTWTEVTAAAAEDDVPGATLAELDEGDKVLIRGKNEAYGYFNEGKGGAIENCNFFADKPCYVYGNIMSLVGGDDFASLREVNEYAFAYFFSDYDNGLNHSWVLSKEGEELLLPATTLAARCYDTMFKGCSSLTTAPELPATTLVNFCYTAMFNDCTNLSYIKAMFTTAPSIVYTPNWVKNVKATGTFVKNSAATWNSTGVHSVPTGWTIETASA